MHQPVSHIVFAEKQIYLNYVCFFFIFSIWNYVFGNTNIDLHLIFMSLSFLKQKNIICLDWRSMNKFETEKKKHQ